MQHPAEGLSYLARFSDEARAEAAKKIKHELLYGLANEIGTGADLIVFWGKQRIGHESSELERAHHEAARNLWDEGFIPEVLPQITEHWNSHDWRGKKGQPPTPLQFFEEALKWRSALKRNGEMFMKELNNPEQIRTTPIQSRDNDDVYVYGVPAAKIIENKAAPDDW